MITIEKRKERIKMWIENIEELGASLRYHNDYENYDKFEPYLNGLKYWCNRIQRDINKINEVKENEKTS